MLYAVSVETTRPMRLGRIRRRVNVFVEARDGAEAEYLARLRFRHRPEAGSLAVRGVRAVLLPVTSEKLQRKATAPKRRKRGAKRRKSRSIKPRGNA
jgi:hypothetical protein